MFFFFFVKIIIVTIGTRRGRVVRFRSSRASAINADDDNSTSWAADGGLLSGTPAKLKIIRIALIFHVFRVIFHIEFTIIILVPMGDRTRSAERRYLRRPSGRPAADAFPDETDVILMNTVFVDFLHFIFAFCIFCFVVA